MIIASSCVDRKINARGSLTGGRRFFELRCWMLIRRVDHGGLRCPSSLSVGRLKAIQHCTSHAFHTRLRATGEPALHMELLPQILSSSIISLAFGFGTRSATATSADLNVYVVTEWKHIRQRRGTKHFWEQIHHYIYLQHSLVKTVSFGAIQYPEGQASDTNFAQSTPSTTTINF